MGGRTYTHPSVFAAAKRGESWADPITDPSQITDWPERRARAAIPFKVVNGRPVNPGESTGIRYGRNELGHWGEQLCADALVTATDKAGGRWIVLVERRDGHGWALPGGYVDPGEHPLHAAIRETKEEAILSVALRYWRETKPRYVPDPRGSDEAWMVTVPCVADLGIVDRLPKVVGRSDARRAIWGPAASYETMTAHLAKTYRGTVFTAHKDMLSDFFAGRL